MMDISAEAFAGIVNTEEALDRAIADRDRLAAELADFKKTADYGPQQEGISALLAENRQLRELVLKRPWEYDTADGCLHCVDCKALVTIFVDHSKQWFGMRGEVKHAPGCIFLTLFPEEKGT